MNRETKTLEAIKRLTESQGYPPSVRELSAEVGVASTSTMFRILHDLKKNGLVDWNPRLTRTLRIIDGVSRSV